MGATEAPELLNSKAPHQSNQPHEIDHSNQSARGPTCDGNSSHCSTTHVTTCAELLPRRYPRASDGQDALTFCPTKRAISDRRQKDATTFSRQTRSLRLLFGSAVGRSELLHPNFLETRKLEDRTKNNRQSAEHLRLDFLPHRSDRTPDATGRVSPVATRTFHGSRADGLVQFATLVLAQARLRQRRTRLQS